VFPEDAAMDVGRPAHPLSPVSPAVHIGGGGGWEHFVARLMLVGFAVVLALEGWLLWRAWHMWIAP